MRELNFIGTMIDMAQSTFDRDLYQAALLGYERSKLDIENKIAELRSLLQGTRPVAQPAANGTTATTRRKMSPAARKRIADAQRRRWARFRQQKAVRSKASKS